MLLAEVLGDPFFVRKNEEASMESFTSLSNYMYGFLVIRI